MAPIKCPVPDCQLSWASETPPEVLLRLIDLHERTAHSTTAQATGPTTTGVKAEKFNRPIVSVSGTSEGRDYFKQRC